MRNVIILGSGRSGTSMVSGTLARSGYFMGDELLSPTAANPKGFFEDPKINQINESLLASVVRKRPPILGRWFFRSRPTRTQYWLATVPLGAKVRLTPPVSHQIRELTARFPFCFKDPRFSYTLPAWRPFLRDTVFICVFRDPATTVASILREAETAPYLRNLALSPSAALRVWTLMYSHILAHRRHFGDWLFLHYDQVHTVDGLRRLADVTGAIVDQSFPDLRLARSKPAGAGSPQSADLYLQLCQSASFSPSHVRSMDHPHPATTVHGKVTS